MPATVSVNGGIVLNSWKEIANYVGRGVRTVQRWERDLGMPVRRPRGKSRSAVIAMSDEIDAWLRSAPTSELNDHQKHGIVVHDAKVIITLGSLHESLEKHEGLRDRCFQLRHANHEALSRLMASVKSLRDSLTIHRKATEDDQAMASSAAD